MRYKSQRKYRHRSYGIIPYTFNNRLRTIGNLHILMVFNKNSSSWGFPKGYGKEYERPNIAALREFNEETGLPRDIFSSYPALNNFHVHTHYPCRKKGKEVIKRVTYFAGEIPHFVSRILMYNHEIATTAWFPLAVAFNLLQWHENRTAIQRFIEKLSMGKHSINKIKCIGKTSYMRHYNKTYIPQRDRVI